MTLEVYKEFGNTDVFCTVLFIGCLRLAKVSEPSNGELIRRDDLRTNKFGRLRRVKESLYMKKALLDALFLTLRNLAVPKLVVKQQSNNDVHGYVIYVCILYTGVGFGVARFDYKSNARASKSEMSSKTDSHASFVYGRKLNRTS